jgi:predicted dehydrogenase
MTDLLRVGVIGLGPAWRQRYRPALQALRHRFAVRVVCDEIQQRALHEARRLRCPAAVGPAELLETDDLDAVLLTEPQWFGLWPLELACRAGKPVFCAVPLEHDEAHADALRALVEQSNLPVLMGLLPHLAPATRRLRQLLAERLGPVRALVVEAGPGAADNGLPVASDLLDWCTTLIGAEPVSVLAAGTAASGLTGLFLEFRDGQAAQFATAAGMPRVRLRVIAERGWATLVLPDRIRWSDTDGEHTQVCRGQPTPEATLLDYFQEAVRGRQPLSPSLEEAYRALSWWRAARTSLSEGRRVSLS